MIDRILAFSVRARWLVLVLVAIISAFGAWQLFKLPIDVISDITNKQVQINTVIPRLGPVEVEKRVTFQIKTALSGLAGVESTRSFSRNGFSQVTAVFKESTDLYFMHQQASERLEHFPT
ncbi:efflux RND transporter permease subunit [Caulobacter sp. DWR2-3-1b2]|uniref:efflux RND transporter permease subunit n=1 Tax=unclassified Caulobacter TaxID=2648921 RepID=UPI003CE67B6B